ncbi:MAG TPA: hypothetical protein VE377_09590 [Candidatus Dormibacteraeota bacterium]|nr:hypothetical protein [Candidatus Dormibacteraeota bacterium]
MIFVDSIFERLILPVIDQKVQAYRTQSAFDSARELLKSQSVSECLKGLSIVRRLCLDNPPNLQEHIDLLCEFVRDKASRRQETLGAWGQGVRSALILICSLPRYDRNNWSYHLDLSNIRLNDLKLERLNLENAALFDSVFHNVDFGYSSFKSCDLGGSVFEASSSVEWCNFADSLMNCSFLTGVATSFFGTRLWGCNLEAARIDRCKVQVVDGYNVQPVLNRHGAKVEVSLGQPQAA